MMVDAICTVLDLIFESQFTYWVLVVLAACGFLAFIKSGGKTTKG